MPPGRSVQLARLRAPSQTSCNLSPSPLGEGWGEVFTLKQKRPGTGAFSRAQANSYWLNVHSYGRNLILIRRCRAQPGLRSRSYAALARTIVTLIHKSVNIFTFPVSAKTAPKRTAAPARRLDI